MNLFNVNLPYTIIDARILTLNSKNTILEALQLYGRTYLKYALSQGWTAYQNRRHNEALSELRYRGIDPEKIEAADAPRDQIAHEDRITIPTKIEYDTLSLSELKTFIALYQQSQHKRSPYFTFNGRQEELAQVAGLRRQAIIGALRKLQQRGLLTVGKQRVEGVKGITGTTVSLLDPESGVKLHYLALFYAQRMGSILPLDRYKLALKGHDPRYQLEGLTGYIARHRTWCPFCREKEGREWTRKRDLEFTYTDEEDLWKCFECGLGGDSARLFTLRYWDIWKETPFALTADTVKFLTGAEEGEFQAWLEAQKGGQDAQIVN
jgi:hypothetical protein